MTETKKASSPKAMSAEEFAALFRRDPDNDRLFHESEARLDLSEKMTEMRHGAGLSQQELANRVGRKQPFIARLEKGAYDRCGLSTLRTFARAMGHDLSVAAMFVQGTAAYFSGKSSCAGLEQHFEIQDQQSGKIASISLVAWDRAQLSDEPKSSTAQSTKATYAVA
jgi:transcriptional regulator with XRE-family HTH domain